LFGNSKKEGTAKQININKIIRRHSMNEKCAICGCALHREKNTYGRPTLAGRSHASKHHYVAERFFGRSKNNPGKQRPKIFVKCPWGHEKEGALFCYDCHEELLHNPVLLPEDITRFEQLVRRRGLNEPKKPESRTKIAGRIRLLHEVIDKGLDILLREEKAQ
jgi:hypothetical protein